MECGRHAGLILALPLYFHWLQCLFWMAELQEDFLRPLRCVYMEEVAAALGNPTVIGQDTLEQVRSSTVNPISDNNIVCVCIHVCMYLYQTVYNLIGQQTCCNEPLTWHLSMNVWMFCFCWVTASNTQKFDCFPTNSVCVCVCMCTYLLGEKRYTGVISQ